MPSENDASLFIFFRFRARYIINSIVIIILFCFLNSNLAKSSEVISNCIDSFVRNSGLRESQNVFTETGTAQIYESSNFSRFISAREAAFRAAEIRALANLSNTMGQSTDRIIIEEGGDVRETVTSRSSAEISGAMILHRCETLNSVGVVIGISRRLESIVQNSISPRPARPSTRPVVPLADLINILRRERPDWLRGDDVTTGVRIWSNAGRTVLISYGVAPITTNEHNDRSLARVRGQWAIQRFLRQLVLVQQSSGLDFFRNESLDYTIGNFVIFSESDGSDRVHLYRCMGDEHPSGLSCVSNEINVQARMYNLIGISDVASWRARHVLSGKEMQVVVQAWALNE